MNYGGAERQIVNLTRCLVEMGDVEVILGLYRATGELLSELDRMQRVEVVDLDRYRSGLVATIFSIRKLINSKNISVVHSLLIGPNLLLGVVSLITTVGRLVWGNRVSCFDKRQFGLKGIVATGISLLLARRVDAIISNSQQGHAALEKIGVRSKRNLVVPNGIDTERFSPSEALRNRFREELKVRDSTILVGQVGRIVDWKGHEVFLRASAEIVKSESNVKFVIVGNHDCAWGSHLKTLSNELGLASKIIWVDAREDVECVLNGLDVLTMNSVSGEGFPNIVGEAMATATAVVGSNVGATEELLSDVGIVVTAGDHQSLAHAWLRFINSREFRKRAGQSGRRKIYENYSLETVGRRTAEVLFPPGDVSINRFRSDNAFVR